MNAKKMNFALLALFGFLTLLTFVIVFLARQAINNSSKELYSLKISNEVLEDKEIAYKKASQNLEKYKELEIVVNEVLPKEKNQDKALKELYQFANDTNIRIEKVEFTTSSLGDTKPVNSVNGVTQARKIPGISGVLGIDLDVTLKNESERDSLDYNNLLNFIEKITYNRRSMQISNLSIGDNKKDAVVSIVIFVKQ